MFAIPLSTALASLFSGLLIIFWLLHRDFKNQLNFLRGNPIVIAFLFYILLHTLGILWTEDINWGLHTLKKTWKFALMPLVMIYSLKEEFYKYLFAFIAGILISVIVNYGIWFNIIEPFTESVKHISHPAAFMSHITFSPLLSFAVLFVGLMLVFKNNSKLTKLGGLLLLIIMVHNSLITGGRTGQIMLVFVMGILIYSIFHKSFYKLFFLIFIAMPILFTGLYISNNIFSDRVDLAIEQYRDFQINEQRKTSVGERLTYAQSGVDIFMENPIFGVGTGDLRSAIRNNFTSRNIDMPVPDNPHNMYIQLFGQFGSLGMLWLVFTSVLQVRFTYRESDRLKRMIGLSIPILFGIANLGETYFSIHATSIFFAVMCGITYSKKYLYASS